MSIQSAERYRTSQSAAGWPAVSLRYVERFPVTKTGFPGYPGKIDFSENYCKDYSPPVSAELEGKEMIFLTNIRMFFCPEIKKNKIGLEISRRPSPDPPDPPEPAQSPPRPTRDRSRSSPEARFCDPMGPWIFDFATPRPRELRFCYLA
jgi:hypothetical protein